MTALDEAEAYRYEIVGLLDEIDAVCIKNKSIESIFQILYGQGGYNAPQHIGRSRPLNLGCCTR